MSPPSDACPICGKPGTAGVTPFCSKRCADIDLGRWLKGGYAIPGAPADPGKNKDENDPEQD